MQMTTTDPFKTALEAALAAKRPVISDDMRVEAIQRLIRSAMDDTADRARLIEVMGKLGAENPQEAADTLIAEAKAAPAAIAASVRPSVTATARPAISDGNDSGWPTQYWRGPPEPKLPDRPPADEISPEEQQARARARLEAERYRSIRQSVYNVVDRSTSWMWRR
jgi:hypothetical protein